MGNYYSDVISKSYCVLESAPGPSSRTQPTRSDGHTIRVLALMEASSITGPAKNLLEFGIRATHPKPGCPRLELTIATFQRGDRQISNPFVSGVRHVDLPVEVIGERFVFDPSVLSQLRRMVAAHRPDIIQTHNCKSHFLTRLAGLHRGRRWIAFVHGYTWPDLKMRFYNQLDRWSLPAADHVVTVCRDFAHKLESIGVSAHRITVRHNAVRPFAASPPEEIEKVRCSLGLSPGIAVVLAVGRLSREKGHLDLIEATARVRQAVGAGRFHVLLAGDGPERSALEHLIQKLHLREAVTLVGQQSDLRVFYSMASLMVVPSHSEGSPNVLLEAMAAGLPSVATAVGGIPEIARDGENALLVAKCSPDAMADRMIRLLEDSELRHALGRAAIQTAEEYNPEVYYSSMLRLYKQVLAEGGS